MDWLQDRMAEPSTWKGIGWLLVACGVLPVEAVPLVVSVGSALIGAVEIVRKEGVRGVK